jgi:hypothetical protein
MGGSLRTDIPIQQRYTSASASDCCLAPKLAVVPYEETTHASIAPAGSFVHEARATSGLDWAG